MVEIGQNITALQKGSAAGQVSKPEPVAKSYAQPVASTKNIAKEQSNSNNEKTESNFAKFSSDEEPLAQAAATIQQSMPNSFRSTKLIINRDEDTGRFVYQGVDRKTGEVLKQFPPEDIMKYLVSVREAEGLVVDGKV